MTLTEPAAAPPPKLAFGPVIQGTFGVLKRNLGTFLALTVLLQGVPLLLMGAGFVGGMNLGLVGSGGLILAITTAILSPALVHGAVADLNGRKPTFQECLGRGARKALPVFAVLFVTGIGAMFGLILLIVPGIMLLIAWSVAAPAKVVEQVGVFGALSRSAALTKGSRWRIFWLFVLYSIVSGAVQQTLIGVATMFTGGAVDAANPMAGLASAVGVVTLITSIVSSLVSYTSLSVIYYELRRIKEGIGPEALAAIFD
jgi:hypothetical protein